MTTQIARGLGPEGSSRSRPLPRRSCSQRAVGRRLPPRRRRPRPPPPRRRARGRNLGGLDRAPGIRCPDRPERGPPERALHLDNGGAETLFDLDQDLTLVTDIIAWLDAHPATACWADYHTQLRAYLVTVKDGWTKARPAVEKGGLVPADVVASGSAAANAANDLPAPANCP